MRFDLKINPVVKHYNLYVELYMYTVYTAHM